MMNLAIEDIINNLIETDPEHPFYFMERGSKPIRMQTIEIPMIPLDEFIDSYTHEQLDLANRTLLDASSRLQQTMEFYNQLTKYRMNQTKFIISEDDQCLICHELLYVDSETMVGEFFEWIDLEYRTCDLLVDYLSKIREQTQLEHSVKNEAPVRCIFCKVLCHRKCITQLRNSACPTHNKCPHCKKTSFFVH